MVSNFLTNFYVFDRPDSRIRLEIRQNQWFSALFIYHIYCPDRSVKSKSCLLLQLKPWGVRGGSHQPTFMSDRRTITHKFYGPIYPVDEGNEDVGLI